MVILRLPLVYLWLSFTEGKKRHHSEVYMPQIALVYFPGTTFWRTGFCPQDFAVRPIMPKILEFWGPDPH